MSVNLSIEFVGDDVLGVEKNVYANLRLLRRLNNAKFAGGWLSVFVWDLVNGVLNQYLR